MLLSLSSACSTHNRVQEATQATAEAGDSTAYRQAVESHQMKKQAEAEQRAEDAKKKDAKTLYEKLGDGTRYEQAIEIMGAPTHETNLVLHYWPNEKLGFWFGKDKTVQGFASAIGYAGETPDIKELDPALVDSLIAKYVDSQASWEMVTQDFGMPVGEKVQRYVYWDFPNGDRVSLLYHHALTNANGPTEVIVSDMDWKVLEEANASDSGFDTSFVIFYMKGYGDMINVEPKKLRTIDS